MSIIVNIDRTTLTKSPSAIVLVHTHHSVMLMEKLPSSMVIVPQMKICFTGLTRKAAADGVSMLLARVTVRRDYM